jgi:hypothetical protein
MDTGGRRTPERAGRNENTTRENRRMRSISTTAAVLTGLSIGAGACSAQVFHDYENFAEGFLGETLVHNGVTYRDVNRVSGFFPDGIPFGPTELGSENIIEQANVWYDSFPTYGSRNNVLTFGRAFINGTNLSLGALASVWMDLDTPATAASLDLGYLENGPWGDIEYILEAHMGGVVVAKDSLTISNLGGRDNGVWQTLSISGVTFDQLHLYGWLNGAYTAPRGIVDDLRITSEPLCYADCDSSTGAGVLDIFDFLCFQNAFVAGDPYACDCDTTTGPGVCDIFDFLCFQNAFVAGCP